MHEDSTAVTVVIPVWDDYAQYVPEAVASVRQDDYPCRVVLIDNASDQRIPEPAGVELVRSPERLSVGGARNLALAQVQSDYVVVLDADDKLLPGTLEFLHGRLRADAELAVCATSILDGETGERHRTPRRFVPSLTRGRRLFPLIDSIWSLYPTQGCTMFRVAEARACGGYADADFGEDWVLAVSLAFRGRVEIHDRLGLYYRHTEGSLWRRRPRRPHELMRAARMVRRRIRSDPAVPAWARTLLPVVAVLQFATVCIARPAFLTLRALLRAAPSPGRRAG